MKILVEKTVWRGWTEIDVALSSEMILEKLIKYFRDYRKKALCMDLLHVLAD